MRRQSGRQHAKTLCLNLSLWVLALVMLFPFVWMVSTSLKHPSEVLSMPPKIFTKNLTLENYVHVFVNTEILRYFLNSLLLATTSTISVLFTSSLAGFVFAKYKFKGRNLLFTAFLATMMMPFETYMIPLYLGAMKLRWIDTYQGILFPWLIMSFGVFLMRQTISNLPDDLMYAARIDGCSEWGIYWRVVLPMYSPALSSLAIFAFTSAWGQFIWPLMITNSSRKFVVELGIAMFQQRYTVEYGFMTAAASATIIPVIILFLLMRRYLVEGIALQGLKF